MKISEGVSIAHVLTKAKEIIAKEENWTQGACARDAEGWDVSYIDSTAICYCSFGAIMKAAWENKAPRYMDTKAHQYLSSVIGTQAIGNWNDSHKHEEVLALFDCAIARAQKDGVE